MTWIWSGKPQGTLAKALLEDGSEDLMWVRSHLCSHGLGSAHSSRTGTSPVQLPALAPHCPGCSLLQATHSPWEITAPNYREHWISAALKTWQKSAGHTRRVFLKIPSPEYQITPFKNIPVPAVVFFATITRKWVLSGVYPSPGHAGSEEWEVLVCKARNLWEILGFSPLPSSNNNWYGWLHPAMGFVFRDHPNSSKCVFLITFSLWLKDTEQLCSWSHS